MKLILTVEKLRNLIQSLERITSKNATLPILNNIFLSVANNTLIARATNLHVGAEYTLPVKSEGEWSCVIPSTTMRHILQSLPGEELLDITFDGKKLDIKAGKAKMALATESVDEFPTLPQIEGGDVCKLPVDVITAGIQSVVYAASVSDIKPEIASVYMYTEGADMVFVATDTFRLAEKKYHLQKTVDGFQALIPAKNAVEIMKLLADIDGEVEIHYTKHQISFFSDGLYCTTRVVDGVYPDYRQIVPKEFTTEMKVLKEELITTLKISDIFSNKFHEMSVSLRPDDGVCVVTSNNNEVGEQEYSLHATITGEPIEVHMNQRYLVEGLSTIKSDSVVFLLTKGRPLIVRGTTDTSFTYLVMPMNR